MKNFDNLAVSGDSGLATQVPSAVKGSEGDHRSPRMPPNQGGLKSSVSEEPTFLRGATVSTTKIRHPLVLFALAGLGTYLVLFYLSISPWWFNPEWTTDDALQQSYPFHRVLNPGVFEGDVITNMMVQYLTPLHYGVTAAMTWLFGDPIMGGHAVMGIQLSITLVALFLAVSHACAASRFHLVPACLAVLWLLHTRLIVQRLTGGLPRGWALPLFAVFFLFAIRRQHSAVIVTLFVGALLHPPATALCALAYAGWVCGEYLITRVRGWGDRSAVESARRAWINALRFVLVAPILFLAAWLVVRMPPEIGTMATLERAAQMPEFSTPDGRFPFYPLKPIGWEISTFGFQAFVSRLHGAPRSVKDAVIVGVVLSALLLALVSFVRRRALVPGPLIYFLGATAVMYLLAREFAFRLYVPDRHLQFPLAILSIAAFSIGAWRLGMRADDKERVGVSLLASGVIVLLVVLGSGSGLQGSANFNYSTTKKGNVFEWMRAHTPTEALIAGEPTLLDGVFLFGMRRGFITTETAHPFYDRYYETIKPRIEVVLRAHYARDIDEFLSLVEPHGIDYFVFERRRFYPEALQSLKYFEPFNALLRELGSRHWKEYAYRQLPTKVDTEAFPAMPFRDAHSVVVDVKALRTWRNTL